MRISPLDSSEDFMELSKIHFQIQTVSQHSNDSEQVSKTK